METQNQKGQGLIEYLILVALIAVATMGVMRVVGQSMSHKFGSIARSLGARIEGQNPTPVVTEAILKKKDMRNFMNGSRGRDEGQTNEAETD